PVQPVRRRFGSICKSNSLELPSANLHPESEIPSRWFSCRALPAEPFVHCVAEGFPVASDSLAIATDRARICAASVVHSLQMKTFLLPPFSGFRRPQNPSHPPPPPKRIRTSGRDLPQKEQVVHGAAIVVASAVSSFFAEVSTPSEGAGTSSVLELDVCVVGA